GQSGMARPGMPGTAASPPAPGCMAMSGMPAMGGAPPADPHPGHAMPGMAMPPRAATPGQAMQGMPAMPGMRGRAGGQMDPNDVDFDAYPANDRTLDDPEIVLVERNARVRLRIINAASSTNFVIDLGALDGELVAVDGNPVQPVAGKRFGLAMA